jgi:hypothetical protein
MEMFDEFVAKCQISATSFTNSFSLEMPPLPPPFPDTAGVLQQQVAPPLSQEDKFNRALVSLPAPLTDLILDYACGENASKVLPELLKSMRHFGKVVFDFNARVHADRGRIITGSLTYRDCGQIEIRSWLHPIFMKLATIGHTGAAADIWLAIISDLTLDLKRVPAWADDPLYPNYWSGYHFYGFSEFHQSLKLDINF